MKLAKGAKLKTKIIELPDLAYRRQIKRLKTEINQLKTQLQDLTRERDLLALKYDDLQSRYDHLESTFNDKLQAAIQNSFDWRTTIAESQAAEAIELSIRYRNLLLQRPRTPVAIAIGQEYKREAKVARSRQAQKIKSLAKAQIGQAIPYETG
jgi:regulator of replication initiation timing